MNGLPTNTRIDCVARIHPIGGIDLVACGYHNQGAAEQPSLERPAAGVENLPHSSRFFAFKQCQQSDAVQLQVQPQQQRS